MLPEKLPRRNRRGVTLETSTMATAQDTLSKGSDTSNKAVIPEYNRFPPIIPQISLAFSDKSYSHEQENHTAGNIVSISKVSKSRMDQRQNHNPRSNEKEDCLKDNIESHLSRTPGGLNNNDNSKAKMPKPRPSNIKKAAKKFFRAIPPRDEGQREGISSTRAATGNRAARASASKTREPSTMKSRSLSTSAKVKSELREQASTLQLESPSGRQVMPTVAKNYRKQRALELEQEAHECWDHTAAKKANIGSDSSSLASLRSKGSPRRHWSHHREGAVFITSKNNDLYTPSLEDDDLVSGSRSRSDLDALNLNHLSSIPNVQIQGADSRASSYYQQEQPEKNRFSLNGTVLEHLQVQRQKDSDSVASGSFRPSRTRGDLIILSLARDNSKMDKYLNPCDTVESTTCLSKEREEAEQEDRNPDSKQRTNRQLENRDISSPLLGDTSDNQLRKNNSWLSFRHFSAKDEATELAKKVRSEEQEDRRFKIANEDKCKAPFRESGLSKNRDVESYSHNSAKEQNAGYIDKGRSQEQPKAMNTNRNKTLTQTQDNTNNNNTKDNEGLKHIASNSHESLLAMSMTKNEEQITAHQSDHKNIQVNDAANRLLNWGVGLFNFSGQTSTIPADSLSSPSPSTSDNRENQSETKSTYDVYTDGINDSTATQRHVLNAQNLENQQSEAAGNHSPQQQQDDLFPHIQLSLSEMATEVTASALKIMQNSLLPSPVSHDGSENGGTGSKTDWNGINEDDEDSIRQNIAQSAYVDPTMARKSDSNDNKIFEKKKNNKSGQQELSTDIASPETVNCIASKRAPTDQTSQKSQELKLYSENEEGLEVEYQASRFQKEGKMHNKEPRNGFRKMIQNTGILRSGGSNQRRSQNHSTVKSGKKLAAASPATIPKEVSNEAKQAQTPMQYQADQQRNGSEEPLKQISQDKIQKKQAKIDEEVELQEKNVVTNQKETATEEPSRHDMKENGASLLNKRDFNLEEQGAMPVQQHRKEASTMIPMRRAVSACIVKSSEQDVVQTSMTWNGQPPNKSSENTTTRVKMQETNVFMEKKQSGIVSPEIAPAFKPSKFTASLSNSPIANTTSLHESDGNDTGFSFSQTLSSTRGGSSECSTTRDKETHAHSKQDNNNAPKQKTTQKNLLTSTQNSNSSSISSQISQNQTPRRGFKLFGTRSGENKKVKRSVENIKSECKEGGTSTEEIAGCTKLSAKRQIILPRNSPSSTTFPKTETASSSTSTPIFSNTGRADSTLKSSQQDYYSSSEEVDCMEIGQLAFSDHCETTLTKPTSQTSDSCPLPKLKKLPVGLNLFRSKNSTGIKYETETNVESEIAVEVALRANDNNSTNESIVVDKEKIPLKNGESDGDANLQLLQNKISNAGMGLNSKKSSSCNKKTEVMGALDNPPKTQIIVQDDCDTFFDNNCTCSTMSYVDSSTLPSETTNDVFHLSAAPTHGLNRLNSNKSNTEQTDRAASRCCREGSSKTQIKGGADGDRFSFATASDTISLSSRNSNDSVSFAAASTTHAVNNRGFWKSDNPSDTVAAVDGSNPSASSGKYSGTEPQEDQRCCLTLDTIACGGSNDEDNPAFGQEARRTRNATVPLELPSDDSESFQIENDYTLSAVAEVSLEDDYDDESSSYSSKSSNTSNDAAANRFDDDGGDSHADSFTTATTATTATTMKTNMTKDSQKVSLSQNNFPIKMNDNPAKMSKQNLPKRAEIEKPSPLVRDRQEHHQHQEFSHNLMEDIDEEEYEAEHDDVESQSRDSSATSSNSGSQSNGTSAFSSYGNSRSGSTQSSLSTYADLPHRDPFLLLSHIIHGEKTSTMRRKKLITNSAWNKRRGIGNNKGRGPFGRSMPTSKSSRSIAVRRKRVIGGKAASKGQE